MGQCRDQEGVLEPEQGGRERRGGCRVLILQADNRAVIWRGCVRDKGVFA